MHDLCSDILEQVANNTALSEPLHVIGVGIHLSSAPGGKLSGVRSIQLPTKDQNLVFRVYYF